LRVVRLLQKNGFGTKSRIAHITTTRKMTKLQKRLTSDEERNHMRLKAGPPLPSLRRGPPAHLLPRPPDRWLTQPDRDFSDTPHLYPYPRNTS
jgi:hypothetical protein